MFALMAHLTGWKHYPKNLHTMSAQDAILPAAIAIVLFALSFDSVWSARLRQTFRLVGLGIIVLSVLIALYVHHASTAG